MDFRITEGIVPGAKKVVFYGPEGIGKSTFSSHFPDPLFTDTEGSTKEMNVKRLPKPTSWQMLIDEVKWIIQTRPCKTWVLDTADWAERLCIEAVCSNYGKKGIEDFGYGNGYTYVAEEWGRFLNLLNDVVDVANINVVLNAHAIIRKFEQPNEMGAYDRWELKLGKKTTGQTAPLTKEWADIVLFANYKTYSVAVDEKGKKHKAQGGQRVMYTTHHPCWDAKNRYDLPEELPLDYKEIAHIFDNNDPVQQEHIQPAFTVEQPVEMKTVDSQPLEPINENCIDEVVNSDIPIYLKDVMNSYNITEDELRKAIGTGTVYPADTPFNVMEESGYLRHLVDNCWEEIVKVINEKIRPF